MSQVKTKKRTKKPIPLAWLQIVHSKVRFVVALAGIALACILIFVQLGFQAALYDSAIKLHEVIQADLVMISPIARNINLMSTIPRRRLYQAMSLAEVTNAEPLYISSLAWRAPEHPLDVKSSTVLGFNTDNKIFKLPSVNQNIETLQLEDRYLFDQKTKGSFPEMVAQIKQGKAVSLEANGRTIYFAGLFSLGPSFGTDGYMITSDLNFLRLFGDRTQADINIGLVSIKPDADVKRVKDALQAQFNQEKDVRILTYSEWIEWEKEYWKSGSSIGFVFGLGVVMGFVVGIIIVYQILYSDVSDHLAEYATLKAMGYKQSYLLKLVFQESLILATLGFIPGYFITILVYNLCRNVTNLPLAMTPFRAVLVFVLTIVMCIVSGAIAVQKLKSADPADVF